MLRRERFAEGAAVLTITTFFSYLTGLLRDRIFARTFGAGRELDIYNASFIIPDLLLNILVSSLLSAAFIPIFTSLFTQGEKEKANELANSVFHTAVGVIIIFAALTAIFMPQLSKFIAPGFSDGDRNALINLSRLMLISPVFMAISSSFGSLLVSLRTFLPYGLSPVFYNLGIIAGTFTVPWFGIYGLVLGTLFGAMLHVLPRFISILASPFRYRFHINLRDTHYKKVLKLMIPKMVGHPVEQLTFFGFTRIATLLAAGSVTAVSFARNFQSVAVSLFGIAFSVAIFPVLSQCAGADDRENFLKNFWKVLRDILFFTIPCALGLFFLSEIPIRIFLGGGKFGDENIFRTARVLSIFALSIPTESISHLLARAFYALKNTVTPVLMSVANLVISVTFAYYKSKTIGIVAIPYGFLLGSATQVALLGFFLRKKIKSLRSGGASGATYRFTG